MGDTEHIKAKTTLKELREWLNFGITALIIPVGLLAGHSISMDIKADVAKDYVTKANYNEDQNRQEKSMSSQLQIIGNIQGKLESMQMEQIHQGDSLALIREQLSAKK